MELKKKTEQQALPAPGGKPAKNPETAKRARKRILLALLGVVVLAVVVLVVWGGPLGVQTETVSAAAFADTFTETGVVKGGAAREHRSPAAGQVAEVCVKRNSAVKAGDVLVRIDPKELVYELESHRNALDGYHAQVNETIRSLRTELADLRAERSKNSYSSATSPSPEGYIESLQKQLDVAVAQEDLARESLERSQTLFDAGAEPHVTVEAAEQAHREAVSRRVELERQLENAESHMGSSGNDAYFGTVDQSYAARIQEAQEKLNDYLALSNEDAEAYQKLSVGQQIAEEQSQIRRLEEKLERCTIRALCDGIVSALPAESLSDVSEGELVATVRESAGLRLEVNVLTNEEPFLKVGDAVTLTQKLKGQQTTYTGKIREIGGYAEKSVSATGADEYRVRVVVDLPENSGLKDGYELEARFTTYSSDAALTVPNSALFKVDGKDCLFVANGWSAELRNVEIAHKASIRTEIASGLSEGETVVSDANREGLEDGAIIMADN